MSMTQTRSQSATYTDADVENVMRRMKADLVMISNSTDTWSEDLACSYAHDIELLAKKGYLAWVDVTLLSYGVEQMAMQYTPNTDASGWTTNRPGALWPKVPSARLRIIINHTSAYTTAAEQALKGQLKINWTSTTEDTSHAALTQNGGRDYSSSSYGLARKDWSK